ncbi:MAG: HYR domain-containing protein [Bacteroidia bacterium]|nr:HYR domain-containing protein [Bacteroidia bacterium]
MVNNYPGNSVWPNKGPANSHRLALFTRLWRATLLSCLFIFYSFTSYAQCDVTVSVPVNVCLGQVFSISFDASASSSPIYPILVDYTVGGVAQPQLSMNNPTATVNFTPTTAGALSIQLTTATDATPNTCTLGAAATTNVNNPILSFTAPADLCINDPVLTGVGGATPTGGIYSGPGVTDDANGLTYTFDPAIAGVGTKTLTYTYTDINGCTNSITDDVVVYAEPTVTYSAGPDVCINDGILTGQGGGSPTGGIYSGTGVTDDANGLTYTFDPGIAGLGTHTLTYTYTDGNGCTSAANDDIEVFDIPLVSFTAPADLCEQAPFQFGLGGGTPTGGTYSGPGVIDDANGLTYTFDPITAGVGIHTITYTYADANGCSTTADDDVEIFALPTVSFSPVSGYCVDAAVQTGLGGGSPAGGTYSGPGVTDDGNGNTFSLNPTTAGAGVHILSYTYTDGNNCSKTANTILEIYALPTVSFAALADVCISAGIQAGLGGGLPAGGTYSGTGVTDDGNGNTFTFDPNAVGLASAVITYSFTDGNNCTNTATSTLDVIPAPTITETIVDESCPGTDDGSITFDATAANGPYTLSISNNGGVTFTVLGTGVTGGTTVSSTGLTPGSYVIKAVDANGCESSKTVTVAAGIDNTPPTAVCQDITVHLDAAGTGSITATQINNGSNDACGIDTVYLDLYNFGCADIGSNTVTLTVEDVNNNISTCTAIVTVVDTVSPTVVCQNINVYLDNNGLASITPADVDNGSADACGIDTMFLSKYDYDCADVGASLVSLTVIDSSGNLSTCNAGITVLDTISPVVICQDVTIYLDGSGLATIGLGDIDNGSSDNCAISSRNLSQSSFGCADTGVNIITLTVDDVNGNSASCTANVTVLDTIPPQAICQDVTIYLDAGGQASVQTLDIDNGSSDICGIDTMFLDLYNFSCTDTGANALNLTVIDNNGNTASCSSVVTVLDTIAPVIICPANIVVNNDPFSCGAQVTLIASASDNCAVTVVNDYNNGDEVASDFYPVGTTVVTFTATDPSGNTSSCSVSVTVNDAENPTAVCPVFPITFALPATGITDISLSPAWANSFDNCGIAQTNFYLNGNLKTLYDCSDIGTHNIIVEVIDTAGNSNTCAATIVIADNLPPTAICQDLTVQLDVNGLATILPSQIDNGSFDICGIDSIYLSQTSFSCSDVGVNSVILSVRDSSGNIGTCTANVTVEDNVAPAVVCQDITVYLGGFFGFVGISPNDIDNGSSDACGIASMSLDKSTFTCADIGTNTVTLTVTDNNSNISTCTAIVTVVDSIAPFASCQDITVQLDASGNASIVAADIDNNSYDACGIDTMFLDIYDFTCADVGTNTVTLTVVDNYNNSAICTATVTVEDTVSPIAQTQNITIQLDANGQASITANDIDNGSSDACGIDTLLLSDYDFDCADVGANTVSLTAIDNNSNSSTATATVTVEDILPPIAICQDLTVYLDTGGIAIITPGQIDNGSSDNCGIASLSLSTTSFACVDTGLNAVVLTVTDVNGNTSSCSANVTVLDTIPPVIDCPADIVVFNDPGQCGATVSYNTPTATDNCGINGNGRINPSITAFYPIGTDTITHIVFDESGNSDTCTFTITVIDNEDPVITCPANVVQNVDPGQCGAVVFYPGVGVSDNCSPVQVTLISGIGNGNFFPVGTTTETYIATDSSGNTDTCSFTVTINDNIAPVMTCPLDISVSNDPGQCGAVVNYALPAVTDNCPLTGPPTLQTGFASGDQFPLGVTSVSYSYTDLGGNTVSCSFNVTVTDTEAPQILCPPDIVVTGSPTTCDAVVTYTGVTASDNCPGTISISLIAGFSSGSTFPVGNTVVSYQAVDLVGNIDTCSFNVTVLPAVAPTTAVINMPNLVEVCAEELLTLSANSPGVGETGAWSFGDPNAIFVPGNTDPTADLTNLLTPTVSGLNPFPLIWTISNNCFSSSDTVYVQVNALPTGFILETSPISANGASNGELLAVPQGGTPPYVGYQWDDPLTQTTQLAVGLASDTYKVVITDDKGCTSDSISYFLDQPPVNPILVDVKVFLQGAYVSAAGLMHDSLRVKHPVDMLTEPYTAMGYAPIAGLGSNSASGPVLNTSGTTAPVDWVFVELRDKINPANILGRQAGLVLRNGSVVDAGDGVSPIGFDLPTDDYYIAVRHRNHLGTMTVGTATVTTGSATSVDFTNLSTATHGNHAQRIAAGVKMLWGGDANGDKSVFYTGPLSDANPIFSKILFAPDNTFFSVSHIVTEYAIEDLSMDGSVIYTGPLTEVNVLFLNILLHPLNTTFSDSHSFSEQIP